MRLLHFARACSLALVASGLAAGCGGTETGNPTLPAVELRLAAFSNDFQSVAIGAPGPGITLERAVMALGQIRLVPCSPGAPPVNFGPVELDLTQKPAALLRAAGTDGEYCSAHVSLTHGAGDELAGRSVALRGTRADGAPFELSSTLELDVDLHTNPPDTPFGARRLILAFNFATWFAGVNVAGAMVEDGLVSIDATRNTAVLDAFDARAGLTPALYDDADGNGQLAGDDQPPTAGP
jgi:hypothetical protein